MSVVSGCIRGVELSKRRYELAPVASRRSMPLSPSEEQMRVLEHTLGALLVLGGPGTGKTETIAMAAAQQLSQEDVGSPLVICHSREAAELMRERITELVGRAIAAPVVTTMHGFCLAMMRRFTEPSPHETRLLSAPEQELRMRQLLAGSASGTWPPSLRLALGTRGFSTELRGFLARGRQLGLDPVNISEAGRSAGMPEWVSAGEFFEEYLDTLDAEGSLDYGELTHRTRILLNDPFVATKMQEEISALFVDEVQELDPSQLGVVAELVGSRGRITAFGDPDQAVFAFRGAHPRGLAEFMRLFSLTESGASIQVLTHSFRMPLAHRETAATIAQKLPLPGLPGPDLVRLRALEGNPSPGHLTVEVFERPADEASFIARSLRRAHLIDGVPWQDMAVIVRSGKSMIPWLRRMLGSSGVPVHVAGDEIPLAEELAVRPLLLALTVTAQRAAMDTEAVHHLLTSPMAGIDAIRLRTFGREMRRLFADADVSYDVPSAAEAIALVMADPALMRRAPTGAVPQAAQRLAVLLRTVRDQVTHGATVSEALWSLWDGTDWAKNLLRDVEAGGSRKHRADRDLDALCALFSLAQRFDTEQHRDLEAFLTEIVGYTIPADTMGGTFGTPPAVRLLTAHRAKNHSWRRVFVAGVQEGSWPNGRAISPLLHTDQLPDTPTPLDRAASIAADRRLFYIAVSRATEELTITACAGANSQDAQPSRFLDELGFAQHVEATVLAESLTVNELIIRLRTTAEDASISVGLRQAAATRLARLADLSIPAADPANWWGVRPANEPQANTQTSAVRLSGSQVGRLLSCPRQYFLAHNARAETKRSSAASLGSVIHAIAQHTLSEGLTEEKAAAALDAVWSSIPFEAPWLSAGERGEAEQCLARLDLWTQANAHRQVIGVEVPFSMTVELPGDTVTVTGVVDRLDSDPDGGLRVVDFKTSRSTPTKAEVDQQDQLGIYQLAVMHGAFEDYAPGIRRASGGELIMLRQPATNPSLPKNLVQRSLTDHPHLDSPTAADPPPTWVHERLHQAVNVIRQGDYPATPSAKMCRTCSFADSCPAQQGQQVVK